MTKLLIPADDLLSNSSRIFHYIYEQQSTSKAAIAHHLRLSLPTVNQHISTLMEEGILSKGDMCESTGGRKAQAYLFNGGYRYAAGIDIWQDSIEMVILDLYGSVLFEDTIPCIFQNSPDYCLQVAKLVQQYIDRTQLDPDRFLGIGISLQGIMSPDRSRVLYGDAMKTAGLAQADFACHLKWPTLLIHNVDAAAYAESFYHSDLSNAFYLFLCEFFGASLIIEGVPYQGDMATGSTIEHMCLVPDGQVCYCGKRGCVEAYCSEKALLSQANESEETFFKNLRAGNSKENAIWSNYLRKLALVIDNIRMVVHSRVIIGGTMAGLINDDDIQQLQDMVSEISSFQHNGPFIEKGICGRRSGAKGAALQYIVDYLNHV